MTIAILAIIFGVFPAAGNQVLYKLGAMSVVEFSVSDDMHHWCAITIHPDSGYRVVADGKPGAWFQEIDWLRLGFSRDWAHWAYVGTRDGRQVLVRDNREEKEYDQVCGEYEQPLFSADGQHLAYTALDADRWVVVRDGKESGVFDQVQPPVFSADNRHLVFAGRKGNRWLIMLDGFTKAEYDYIESARFLPDGSLTYIARDKERWFLVRGTKKGPAYDEISQSKTSRDGNHYAYAARTGEKWRIVFDGKPAAEYDNVADLTISPSGRHLAYAAGSGTWTYDNYFEYYRFDGSFATVRDGRELRWGPEGFDVEFLTFSADEAHVAYSIGKIGESGYVVVDTTAGPAYRGVVRLTYAPVGNRLAYSVYQSDTHFVVLDDRRLGPYDDVEDLRFSADGSHVIITARQSGKWRVVIDGTDQDPFEKISYIRYSPDGQYAGVLGIRDKAIYRVVYKLNSR
jgi:hypothetical protein